MKFKTFKTFVEDIEIERKEKEAIATVTGKDSEKFTKIAKKLLEIEMAEEKIKKLREELKQHAREDIAALFQEAEDKFKTRRVETMSVLLTLSKDPEPRKTVAWKAVVEDLLEMVSELNEKINELIEKHTKLVQVEPSLSVTKIKNPEVFKDLDLSEKLIDAVVSSDNTKVLAEGFMDRIKEYFDKLFNFFKKYDYKLASVRRRIQKYRLES